MNKFLIILISPLFFVLCSLFLSEANAQSSLKSTNYEITLPNLNIVSGKTTSPGYSMGVTGGQTAPGLYSNGYKIRAGFQYIHSVIPFSFRLSALALDFGTLTSQVLTNEKTLTLTVNSGSAGGYQVTVQENDNLKSTTGSEIEDTSCDPGDTCDYQTDAGTWTQTTTYGFGYNMSGTDIPTEFADDKFKRFSNAANTPTETPTKVMGLTPLEGHEAERNKIATMSARINIDTIQAAGVYQNILTFTAIPTY
ncbi:hypothetical protein MUP35_02115 [Patescibacteria group bacterium]|nr:hypothetical protein [Patescibacteria group bacterium]